MKIGLQIPYFNWPGTPQNTGPLLHAMARTADQGGFASLWVMDHFFGIGSAWGEAEVPMLEAYTTLSYMAAATTQVRLGVMVTGAIYRHPALLIKMVTSLDVLTQGRTYLGIGAGWYARESTGFGIPFPATRERIARLEETLQIAKQMWRADATPFHGDYYHLEEPMNNPQPIAKPHPPILIGGEGEKQTLRLVASYGDACNFQLGTSLPGYPAWYREIYAQRREHLGHKLAILCDHCQRIGRAEDEIERTVLGSIKLGANAMSVNEVVETCHELAEMGFQQVIYNLPDAHEITPLEVIAQEIIPRVRAF